MLKAEAAVNSVNDVWNWSPLKDRKINNFIIYQFYNQHTFIFQINWWLFLYHFCITFFSKCTRLRLCILMVEINFCGVPKNLCGRYCLEKIVFTNNTQHWEDYIFFKLNCFYFYSSNGAAKNFFDVAVAVAIKVLLVSLENIKCRKSQIKREPPLQKRQNFVHCIHRALFLPFIKEEFIFSGETKLLFLEGRDFGK